MYSVTAMLRQLLQYLDETFPDSAGLRYFDASFTLNEGFEPLSWLASQVIYPQFYWQQRDGDEEIAALGVLQRFFSLAQAQQFISQHPQITDLRVCGVNAFEPGEGWLFLPRLEWRRHKDVATVRLWLCSETSLRQDALQARNFLQELVTDQLSATLNLRCVAELHYPDAHGWQALITKAIQHIAAGEFDKVVLARASDLQFTARVNAASLLAASRRQNFRCYHFFMAFDADNAFLGSSPERLWRRCGQLLRTEALAGTVASHTDSVKALNLGQWLLKDDKNQRENTLVVEDICQRLRGKVSALDILPMQVVRLRNVQHLRRCIWAELITQSDAECLLMLQPTAAVAGLPRESAKRFIMRYEPFRRQWYAGSVGYLSAQQSEFCVSLRCASVNGETVRLYAGAGILQGSDPQQEWLEIENKAAGLRSLLTD